MRSEITIELGEHPGDGAGAAAAAHRDVKFVAVSCHDVVVGSRLRLCFAALDLETPLGGLLKDEDDSGWRGK